MARLRQFSSFRVALVAALVVFGLIVGPSFAADVTTPFAGKAGSTVTHSQLTLVDLKGNALPASQPLEVSQQNSVLGAIVSGGVGAFPDQHSLSIILNDTTYIGTLTQIGALGTIAATPEPDAVFLIGSGLLGLVAWRRLLPRSGRREEALAELKTALSLPGDFPEADRAVQMLASNKVEE